MPSFLSKVFGRKKGDNHSPRGRSSDGSLLDGKFEAVSPTVSPSAAEFPENARILGGQGKEKAKESGFGLFKIKSRPSSPERRQPKDNLPQLSLLLPLPKEDTQLHPLSINFELDPDARGLTDTAISNKRLDPSEALILIRTCSQAINARGLETLGLMHPHWHSASPDIQRRLISLFVHSLTTNASANASSSAPSLSTSAFESEVNYARSPHDVAAVLRWGLRHLELNGNSFGKEDSWYTNFVNTEKSSDYPPKVYSQSLVPLLPSSHFQLLDAVLELFSTLAAHAEKNGTSGSKLTRTFGFWLLAVPRVVENDDWSTFYARWVRTGRILEHLFLARIRDQSLSLRLPTRLLELVTQYPYNKGATIEDDILLSPRLSTAQHDALFVRIETETSSSKENIKWHPLRLVKSAFDTEITAEKSEYVDLWEKIRKASSDGNHSPAEDYPGLGRVFADETIRYLTLIPGDHPWKGVASPTVRITHVPAEVSTSHQHPSSPEGKTKAMNGTSITPPKPTSELSPLPSSSTSPLEPDWMQFSTSGFSAPSPVTIPLASTLFGQDMEKTNPPVRHASKHTKPSSGNASRKSVESPQTAAIEVAEPKPEEPQKFTSKSTLVSMIQVDGAFIDFWTDALLDPISSNWPTFVICKLNSSVPRLTVGNKHLDWLVIEHLFVPEPQPIVPESEPVEPAAQERARAPSPRSSIMSEKRFFNFFTSSSRRNSSVPADMAAPNKGWKKFSPEGKVNELGQVLKEEEEKPTTTVKLRIPSPKPRKSVDASRRSVDVTRKSMEGSYKPADTTKESNKEESTPVEPKGVKKETSMQIPAAVADATNAIPTEVQEVNQSPIAKPLTSEVKDKTNDIAASEPGPLADHIAVQEAVGAEISHQGVTSPVSPLAVSTADIVPAPDAVVSEQVVIDAIPTQSGNLNDEAIERSFIHVEGKGASEPETVTIAVEPGPASETHPSTPALNPFIESEVPTTNDIQRASDVVNTEQETVEQVSLPPSDSTAQETMRASLSPVVETATEVVMAGENEAEPSAIDKSVVEVPNALAPVIGVPVTGSMPIGTTVIEEPVAAIDTSETVPEESTMKEPIERVIDATTEDQQSASASDVEQEFISEGMAEPVEELRPTDITPEPANVAVLAEEISTKNVTEPVQSSPSESIPGISADQVQIEEIQPVESAEKPAEVEAAFLAPSSSSQVQIEASIHVNEADQETKVNTEEAANPESGPGIVKELDEQDTITAAESSNAHPTTHTLVTEDRKDTVGQSSDIETIHVIPSSTEESMASVPDTSTSEPSPDMQHINDSIESGAESNVMQGSSANGEVARIEHKSDETHSEETPSKLEKETHVSSTATPEPLTHRTETTEDAEGQDISSTVKPSESTEQGTEEKQTQSENTP